VAEKNTHFGRAGEYFAMSELLLRGWNVAVPVVDVGDDVFVINDKDKTTYRVQVKTANPASPKNTGGDTSARSVLEAKFELSREQLAANPPGSLLFYVLLTRDTQASCWRFLVIPRKDLADIRARYLAAWKAKPQRGRPPLEDHEAKGDQLMLTITLEERSAQAWDAPLDEYLDRWPEELSVDRGGPGSAGVTEPDAGPPDRSPDQGT